MPAISEAYQNLIDTLKHRETDKGIQLYSPGANYEYNTLNLSSKKPAKGKHEKFLLDLFAVSAVRQSKAHAAFADHFQIKYRHAEAGAINTGFDTITSREEAAHVCAPFRKHTDIASPPSCKGFARIEDLQRSRFISLFYSSTPGA